MYLDETNVGGSVYELHDTGARAMTSDEYDQSKTYAVGDYCIYENSLYKCTAAATGVWDATKWKKTAVGTELSEQNVKIQNIEDTDILNGLYIGSNYTVNTPPTKKGIRVFASSSASGAPVPGTSLGIQIWTGNTTVVQVMFSSSAIHFRRSSDGGTTWGSWYKCSGTEM